MLESVDDIWMVKDVKAVVVDNQLCFVFVRGGILK